MTLEIVLTAFIVDGFQRVILLNQLQ